MFSLLYILQRKNILRKESASPIVLFECYFNFCIETSFLGATAVLCRLSPLKDGRPIEQYLKFQMWFKKNNKFFIIKNYKYQNQNSEACAVLRCISVSRIEYA